MTIRTLIKSEVEFELTIEPEFIPVENNYILTDDLEYNRKCEKELLDRIYRGDNSAWCILVVKATWNEITGSATLGAFVFPEGNTGKENEAFIENERIQLENDALNDLNSNISAYLKNSDYIISQLSA